MRKSIPIIVAIGLVTAGCPEPEPPPPPPPPDTVVITDTITITQEVEVAPPLPDGAPSMLCLATGQNVRILISPAGDTLIGPQRVRLMDLGPAIQFSGNYAGDEAWFLDDEAVTYDERSFSKFGQPEAKDCDSVRIVGDFNGVNLFGDLNASAPFRILYVPVRPGVFQPYQVQVGRVRG